jgi:glycosyltransferase involved in cell wall biosynthesis
MSLVDWLSSRQRDGKYSFIVLLPRHDAHMESLIHQAGCGVKIGYYSVPATRIRPVSGKTRLKDFLKKIYGNLVNPIRLRILTTWARRKHVELVHTNSFSTDFGVRLAMRLGVPHVWHIREFMELDYGITQSRNRNITRYCGYSSAVFISPVIRDYYESKYHFSRGQVILNRIRFDPDYSKTRAFMEDGVCRLMLAGNISAGKGQRQAIEAIKKLHQEGLRVRLDLCGQGDYSQLSDLLTPDTQSYIRCLGFRSDLTSLRANEDVELVCSKMEALGRVTVEALYYKNLVIGANSGFTAKLIRDGVNGYLYDYGDIKSLSHTIAECMRLDPIYVDTLETKASKETVSVFSHDISPRIYSVYDTLLHE